jgi:predicted aspartyl protease
MAKSYTFERHTEDDLILITAQLDNSVVDFVLDTGASHTFIDFGILIKEGYRKNDTKGIVPIETANGIIFADRYIVSKITALGITKTNFEVTSYLFDEPESDFKGVIGLDFLIDNEFCISLKKSLITIKS